MKRIVKGTSLLAGICILVGISLVLAGCSSSSKTTSTNSTTTTIASTTVNSGNTSISAVPSADTVKPGDKFDVSIMVTNDKPSRGVQFSLSWDPSKLQCDSVDQGDYFKNFVQANNGDLFIVPSANALADNVAGKFPKTNDNNTYLAIAMTGAMAADNSPMGVSGSGNVYILHMEVKVGASGIANLTLANTKVVDPTGNNLNAAVKNGEVTISP